MQRTNSTNWSVGDQVSAARLQDFNEDLDALFAELSNENVAVTYDWLGQLTQIVDSDNWITINLTWTDFAAAIPKLYVQKVGDPKKYTITYSWSWYIQSIVYA